MKNQITPTQLFSQLVPEKKISRILQYPLSRIFVAFLFLIPVILTNNLLSIFVLDGLGEPLGSYVHYATIPIFIFLLFILYAKYTKSFEGRKAFELNFNGWYKEFGIGLAIGGGMVVIITAILWMLNFYAVDHLNSPQVLFTGFLRYGYGSLLEELIFTIIFFRLIEEYSGTLVSFIATSMLFGLMHLGNDGATLGSSSLIMLEHVVILAPFMLTRRIWMVWAIHLSWNYFQTAVFGMNNSGMAHGGFITPNISGPEWITGGSFGIEASYLSILVNIAFGLVILIVAIKREQFVKIKNPFAKTIIKVNR
ncbi:MAG: hypothetical protein CVU00_14395 [Bacteroidetes bacterium HGW-Bacteroidetes-17]|jgi:hypothetical protein|nr:MAG: hypothetical protein CVU00_14395 [Bacteroidetes bacterium HGW-Bacteroidetes-17]